MMYVLNDFIVQYTIFYITTNYYYIFVIFRVKYEGWKQRMVLVCVLSFGCSPSRDSFLFSSAMVCACPRLSCPG